MRGRSVIRNNPSLKTFTSPGSKVIVSFITDSIGASYGFELTYQGKLKTGGCALLQQYFISTKRFKKTSSKCRPQKLKMKWI